MEYVIIGNSAAAVGAVESIRRVDQRAKLTVVSSEKEHVYSRPLIAHYLAGEVSEDRLPYRPADFYSKNNVTIRLGTGVAVGDLGHAGAVNNLIKEQALVGIIKDSILEEKYQLYHYLRRKREAQLEGTAIEWPETHSSAGHYEKSFNEETWTEREQDKRAWR